MPFFFNFLNMLNKFLLYSRHHDRHLGDVKMDKTIVMPVITLFI